MAPMLVAVVAETRAPAEEEEEEEEEDGGIGGAVGHSAGGRGRRINFIGALSASGEGLGVCGVRINATGPRPFTLTT